MSITTILLDAGGVILDESQHEKVRAEVTAELLAEIVPGYSTASYFSDIEDAVSSFCPNAYQYVFWKHSKGNGELFDKLWDSYIQRFAERRPTLKLSDGLAAELKPLSSAFDVGIAGQYGRELLHLLRDEAVLDAFRFRFTQDDFSLTKPDPRYFEQIAEACGARSWECVMVGDRVDKDVIPAKMLGMKTVLIRTGLHSSQQPRIPSERPDVELSSVVGLAASIQRLAACH